LLRCFRCTGSPDEATRRIIKEPAFREAARHLGRIIAEDAWRAIGIQELEHVAGATRRELMTT
jgi:hypothetical protein